LEISALGFGGSESATCVSAGGIPFGIEAVVAAKSFRSIKNNPFEVNLNGYSC
jgi:hypothetical protein